MAQRNHLVGICVEDATCDQLLALGPLYGDRGRVVLRKCLRHLGTLEFSVSATGLPLSTGLIMSSLSLGTVLDPSCSRLGIIVDLAIDTVDEDLSSSLDISLRDARDGGDEEDLLIIPGGQLVLGGEWQVGAIAVVCLLDLKNELIHIIRARL